MYLRRRDGVVPVSSPGQIEIDSGDDDVNSRAGDSEDDIRKRQEAFEQKKQDKKRAAKKDLRREAAAAGGEEPVLTLRTLADLAANGPTAVVGATFSSRRAAELACMEYQENLRVLGKVDSNTASDTLIRVCGCGETQGGVACSEVRMSYHKTSRKFHVTRAAPRLCTVEMKASRRLGSTNYTREMLVPLCVQQTTDVNQVMPKRLRAVLRLYCVLELGDTFLSHLAEKVRHAKLGGDS